MVRERVVVCVRLPETAVIVSENVPAGAAGDVDRPSVEEALLPEVGVTLAGDNAAVTPEGRPDAARFVAPLKPLRLVTLTAALPPSPAVRATTPGETVR